MTISSLAVGTDAIPSKGTTSPVSYPVEKASPTLVGWSDFAGAIFALNKTASIGWRYPTAKSKLHRVTYVISTPLDRPVTDAGSNTTHVVAGTLNCKMEFVIPTLATSAERSEFLRRVVQTILDSQFEAAVTNLSFPL